MYLSIYDLYKESLRASLKYKKSMNCIITVPQQAAAPPFISFIRDELIPEGGLRNDGKVRFYYSKEHQSTLLIENS